jgi:hypothetical protein
MMDLGTSGAEVIAIAFRDRTSVVKYEALLDEEVGRLSPDYNLTACVIVTGFLYFCGNFVSQ